MSVLLTPKRRKKSMAVHISNGEWAAIVAASRAFGINVPQFENHDPEVYSAFTLKEMSVRMKQLGETAERLISLSELGGAALS